MFSAKRNNLRMVFEKHGVSSTVNTLILITSMARPFSKSRSHHATFEAFKAWEIENRFSKESSFCERDFLKNGEIS